MDEATALAQNLTFYSGDHFVIRADHTARLSAGGPGRNSVRLQSNKKYTTHVTVCVPPLPSFYCTCFLRRVGRFCRFVESGVSGVSGVFGVFGVSVEMNHSWSWS